MSDMQTPNSAGQPPKALIKALRKLLRPIVRLLLSFQITYPFLINLLKTVYVEVADREFSVDNKRQSDSRINLLTGVHRKDVKRLRSEKIDASSLPRSISIGAQLIAYWLGSPQFCDAEGNPIALPLRAGPKKSSTPSFDDLVELVCRQDIRPRVILDEWLHLGIAHLDSEERVILNTGTFTPDKGFDEKAFFFGKNLHDHIAAGTHNLLGRKPAYFDRSVYYDRLSEESVKALNELATELGMKALINMNNAALKLQQVDAGDHGHKASKIRPPYRMNFGIFHYNDLHEDPAVPEQTPDGNPVAKPDRDVTND